MSQRAKQAGEGPGKKNESLHERHILFSQYSAFAHERSILIGEKWQVLLIWPKPAAIIKHKRGVHVGIQVWDLSWKLF